MAPKKGINAILTAIFIKADIIVLFSIFLLFLYAVYMVPKNDAKVKKIIANTSIGT